MSQSKRDQATMRRVARGLRAEERRALASPEYAAAVEQSRSEVEALRAAREAKRTAVLLAVFKAKE